MQSDDQSAVNEAKRLLRLKKGKSAQDTVQPDYSGRDRPTGRPTYFTGQPDPEAMRDFEAAQAALKSEGAVIDLGDVDDPELPAGVVSAVDTFMNDNDASGSIPVDVDDSQAMNTPFGGVPGPMFGIEDEEESVPGPLFGQETADPGAGTFSVEEDRAIARGLEQMADIEDEADEREIDSAASGENTVRFRMDLPSDGGSTVRYDDAELPSADEGEHAETVFHPGPSSEAPAQTVDTPPPSAGSGSKQSAGSGSRARVGKADDLPEDISIAGFKDVEFIAKGADGAVYRAKNELMETPTALKFLRTYDESKLQRFAKEVEVLRELGNIANIVSVYSFGMSDVSFKDENGDRRKMKIPCLEQRLMHGSLERLLRKNSVLPTDDVVEKSVRIARALQKTHDKGIIHRDLKPDNVLLDSQGEWYIADLGLALLRNTGQASEEQGQIAGTPYYMSPEQALGDVERVDSRSDVYGLGAIMYRVLTGSIPRFYGEKDEILSFDGRGIFDVLKIVSSNDLVPLRKINRTVPRDLADIVETAMAKEQWRRYDSTAELADDLERYKKGLPPKASKKWLPTRVVQTMYAHKVKTLVASALVAVSVFAGKMYNDAIIVEENKERIRSLARSEVDEAQRMRERSSVSSDAAVIASAVVEYEQAVSALERLRGIDASSELTAQIDELKRTKSELEARALSLTNAQRLLEQERNLDSLFESAREDYDRFRQESAQSQIAGVGSMTLALRNVRDMAVRIDSGRAAERISSIDRMIAQANDVASAARLENEQEECAQAAQELYDSAFRVYQDISAQNVLENYEGARSALNQALAGAQEWSRKDEESALPDNMIASIERTVRELEQLHGSVRDSADRARRARDIVDHAERDLADHRYASARQRYTEAQNLSPSSEIKNRLDSVIALHERYNIERVQHAYESIFGYQAQVSEIWTSYYRAQIRSSVRDDRLRSARESLEAQLERPSRNGSPIAELSHIALDRDYFREFTDTQARLAEESTRLLIDTDRAQEMRRTIEQRDAAWSALQRLNTEYVQGAINREQYESLSAPLLTRLRGE